MAFKFLCSFLIIIVFAVIVINIIDDELSELSRFLACAYGLALLGAFISAICAVWGL